MASPTFGRQRVDTALLLGTVRRRGRPPRWESRDASPRRARSLCSASAWLVGPRSASARQVLPGARLVPRRSPLGPVGPARTPRSLSSTIVAAAVSAPLRGGRRAASLLGPVDPARIYRFLSSTTVAAAVPAPLRECGPARIPRSLSSTTVVAVISAPRARGAAAGLNGGFLPGARLVPRRSPLGPVGPARILRSFS